MTETIASGAPTRLVRTKGGASVHRRGCRYAAMGWSWFWAESRGRSEILAACVENDIRRCSVCDPLWEDDSRTHRVAVSA